MKKTLKTVVIDLGGSVIVPGEIQVKFLKEFKKFILKFLKKDIRIVIVAGGGSVARNYIKAASEISAISDEDKDWLGIHATRINAHLLRTIFKKQAYPIVLDSPLKQISGKSKSPLFIASGWRPGWSTDYDAILLAERFKAEKTIIASNIDYVYEKDLAKYKDAKPIKELNWKRYRGLISSKWKPGMRSPVDPVAARLAAKLKMEVIIVKGTDLKNLENVLTGKKFKGTTIK